VPTSKPTKCARVGWDDNPSIALGRQKASWVYNPAYALYKMLHGERKPQHETVVKLLNAVGVRLTVKAITTRKGTP
jgi:hypothetical protein